VMGRFNLTGIAPAPRGVPQIEVTFDLDTNGILNVSAVDKGSGKTNKITITNDSGRLTKDQIDRMVQDAQKYAEDDRKVCERISSKNNLESLCASLRQQLSDAESSGNSTDSGSSSSVIKELRKRVDDAQSWMDHNENADKEEIEHKIKELESFAQSFLSSNNRGAHHQQKQHASEGQQYPGRTNPGPTVEEVD